MPKLFSRKIEDFICEHCGVQVKGNGYTNHCPNCLYSKHVDENPGDRAAKCGGLMKPAEIVIKNSVTYIKHRCEICGHEKLNKTAKNDNTDKIISISSGRF